MTGAQFITEVKVKLNRLDTSSYEDVRPEEVLYFGYEALKAVTLEYDQFRNKGKMGREGVLNYLASLTKSAPAVDLVANKVALEDMFKLKDVAVLVSIGNETGWMPTRFEDNVGTSREEYNPFKKSYPDMPRFRVINNNIEFETNGFDCQKIKYDYLVYPTPFDENTDMTMVFISDLEDKTVTLILENLESRRLQSQAVVSNS